MTENEMWPTSEPWMEAASCAQSDPERWFPPKGHTAREARALCAGCFVTAECLSFALRTDARHGVYGGLTERERDRLLKGGRVTA